MVTSDRPMPALPIDPVLPRIAEALGGVGTVVVEAPPGAGKTTRVPLAVADQPWCDGRVLVLEPRRLAARAGARRMSQLVGDEVGGLIGYTTREDRRTSRRTRVEVVTEGILTNRIQRDPSLDGVAVVIFDEFHERSLQADLGLALSLEAREALRDDLRVAVMSATLDGRRVADLIGGGCEVVTTQGRLHPVETRWRPRARRTAPIEPDVVDVVSEALAETDGGDVLVFLPGAREIRRVQRGLGDAASADGRVLVAPLFGALPPTEQDRALDPAPPGTRKVVLATDIAETSLTIEGVRVVVDAGLSREPAFDPRTGMSRLVTVPVSKASADQRRGRAGRVAPGVCYRLWSQAEHHALEPYHTPEIAQADLAGLALEVARWGASGPGELRLLDDPPEHAYAQARGLLADLGVIAEDGSITERGRAVAELPTHPRLGHMILEARTLGAADGDALAVLACEVAALLEERDIVTTGRDRPSSDLSRRVDLVRGGQGPPGGQVRRGGLHRVRRQARRLARAVDVRADGAPSGRTGQVLAAGYPDRVAQRRAGTRGSFLLSNGRGASLRDGDPLAGEDLLVVADVDAGATEARIYRAAAIDPDQLETVLGDRIGRREVVEWDDDRRDVVAERRTTLGAIVLDRTPIDVRGDERTIAALLEGVRREGLELLGWSRAARELRARLAFLRRTFGAEWPDVSADALLDDLETWLAPFLLRARRRADLERVPLVDALRARLDPAQLARLDELAPTHLQVPSGARIRLDYVTREVPVLPVRVQEMFGETRTPRVADGRVPVLLRLLSPAQRPVQITDDLAGFWERTYHDVRADLRGRYPKHDWPEDPRRARPGRR